MAIDTTREKLAIMSMSVPVGAITLPLVSGTLDDNDKMHLLGLPFGTDISPRAGFIGSAVGSGILSSSRRPGRR